MVIGVSSYPARMGRIPTIQDGRRSGAHHCVSTGAEVDAAFAQRPMRSRQMPDTQSQSESVGYQAGPRTRARRAPSAWRTAVHGNMSRLVGPWFGMGRR